MIAFLYKDSPREIFQYCSLGRLSHEVGWKYQDVVETLEAKRRVKAEAYYKKASTVAKIRQQVGAGQVSSRLPPGFAVVTVMTGHAVSKW